MENSFACIASNIAENGMKIIDEIIYLWNTGYDKAILLSQGEDIYKSLSMAIYGGFDGIKEHYERQLKVGVIEYMKEEY